MCELTRVVIIGAGGFAREVLDIFDAVNQREPQYDVLGFVVDSTFGEPGTRINDKPILGDFLWLERNAKDVSVICGVGASQIRLKMISRLKTADFCSIIHPSVVMTRWTTIGKGTVIAAGCVVSNQVSIGSHVQLNPCCTIGHDVTLGDYVSLAPGVLVSGNVTIETGAYVGTGAKIIEKKRIGRWSIVGAGATVIKEVPPNSTVVGVPSKVIKTRSEGWQLEEIH